MPPSSAAGPASPGRRTGQSAVEERGEERGRGTEERGHPSHPRNGATHHIGRRQMVGRNGAAHHAGRRKTVSAAAAGFTMGGPVSFQKLGSVDDLTREVGVRAALTT